MGSDIVNGDSIEVFIRYSGFVFSDVSVNEISKFYIITYNADGLSGTRHLNLITSGFNEIASGGDSLVFRVNANLTNPSDLSFHIAISILDDEILRRRASGKQEVINEGTNKTYTYAGQAPINFFQQGDINTAFQINEIGLSEGSGLSDIEFFGDGSDANIHVKITYTGQDPASLNSLDLVWYSSAIPSGVMHSKLTNITTGSVTIDPVADTIHIVFTAVSNPFPSTIKSFQLAIQMNVGQKYLSHASEPTDYNGVTPIGLAPSGYGSYGFFHVFATINKIGIRAYEGAQNSTIGDSIDIKFQVNAGTIPATAYRIRLFQFVGGSEVRNSNLGSYNLHINGDTATVRIRGPVSWENASVTAVAVGIRLESNGSLYVSKNISGESDVLVSDSTVNGNYFSTLIRTNKGPNPPQDLSYRYGSPNDNRMHFTWTDGTANDASILKHLLVYSAIAINGDTTVGTKIPLGANQGNDYDLTMSAGTTTFVTIFTVDINNQVAYAEYFNGGSVNRNDGLTINIAGSAILPNIPPGTTVNNELLSFNFDRTGAFTSTDSALISSITFKSSQQGNVTSDTLKNLRIYRDNNTIGTFEEGIDQLISTTNPSFATPFITINLGNIPISNSSGVVRMILVGDVVNGKQSQSINVSINDSQFTVTDITAASRSGSVAAQGAGAGGDITLPVNIVDFSAERVKEGFSLFLQTAQESDVRYIIYQRSTSDKPISELTN
ncbi:MAG: hypothetical protein KDD94_08835, partial [Calditrichaeota bacterium]|nr:hypothetical protein [Calditrichota bacterium]